MIKIIDIDKLFDNYISDYVYGNIGKIKPEEIEDEIPKLYEKFGDTKLKELDQMTPSTYYKGFSDADKLVALKEHLNRGVPISDFLCEALEQSESAEREILKELNKDDLSEEYTLYLMNILESKNSDICLDRYLDFVMYDYSDGIREFATEVLSEFADKVRDKIIASFDTAGEISKACFTEILSHVTERCDKVFDILIEQFALNQDKIPLYASYISRYGDDRALTFLYASIENEKLSYADFTELRFCIESLGGEYESKRDFTHDKTYKKIKEKQELKAEEKK